MQEMQRFGPRWFSSSHDGPAGTLCAIQLSGRPVNQVKSASFIYSYVSSLWFLSRKLCPILMCQFKGSSPFFDGIPSDERAHRKACPFWVC